MSKADTRPPVDRTRVESSNIRSIGWAIDCLDVEFISGGLYRYYGASDSVLANMLAAASVGRFFASEVKNTYPCRRWNGEEWIATTRRKGARI